MMQPNNSDSTPISKRLRALRGGLTQHEAEARAGLSSNSWQRIELGTTKRPTPKTIRKIAEAFNVDFDELWSYVDVLPTIERFTDEELDRLARRLAPFLGDQIIQYLKRR
jgi:transcriptional regulator with XRE-family HTH domain